MINAMEVFSLIPTTNVGTDSIDGECTQAPAHIAHGILN
jgi:hypothetical protein